MNFHFLFFFPENMNTYLGKGILRDHFVGSLKFMDLILIKCLGRDYVYKKAEFPPGDQLH